MNRRGPNIDADVATQVVRQYLDPGLTVVRVAKLHGGMINRVYVLMTDGEPGAIVAKTHDAQRVEIFRHEAAGLRYLREHTNLPVVQPLAVIDRSDDLDLSGLLLSHVDAVNLSDARLSPRGIIVFQEQLAHHLAELHRHTRDRFGSPIGGDEQPRWLDMFAPMIRHEFDVVRDQLSIRARNAIEDQLDRLDRWLDDAPPALVHGDLWATNILVDDRHPDRPAIQALIDPAPAFADAEYELAYVRLFKTADNAFLRAYASRQPLRPGFDRRCRIYWLHTMMLHVHRFGDRYLSACEDLAHQLRKLA